MNLKLSIVLGSFIFGLVTGQHYESKRNLLRECETGYSVTCMKLDIISFIERMSDNPEYNFMSGISLVREKSSNSSKNMEIVAEMARSYPGDPEKRLNGFLLTKLANYLQSHSLRLKLFNSQDMEEARAAFNGEARGKGGGGGGDGGGKKGGGGGGGMHGMIAAACMMKSTLAAIALGAVALLAGKALMTAMIALMLSAIIGLKSLSGGGKSTTYEIIAKPSYTNSHSQSHEDVHSHGHSGYGGYGRSLNLAIPDLPYTKL